MGNRSRIIGKGIKSHTSQPNPGKTSDDVSDVRPESQAVTVEDPLDGDHSESDKTLHDRAENIF